MDSNPGPVAVMGESPKERVHLNPDHGERSVQEEEWGLLDF